MCNLYISAESANMWLLVSIVTARCRFARNAKYMVIAQQGDIDHPDTTLRIFHHQQKVEIYVIRTQYIRQAK